MGFTAIGEQPQQSVQPRSGFTAIEDPSKSLGESMPGIVKGAISTLQGPAMGFADELAGVGGAVTGAIANLTPYGDGKSLIENYRSTRDAARAASESHMKENPVLGHVERIAASIPVFAAMPVAAAADTALGRIAASAKSGGIFGTVAGFGETNADNARQAGMDTAISAGIGSVLGPVLGGAVNATGAVMSNIAQTGAGRAVRRILPGSPADLDASANRFAQEKIAEAMLRDKSGIADPINKAASRIGMLGNEATVADSAGANTRTLLDTLATLPGETKNAVEQMIRGRQAGRADRLTQAAQEGLSPTGARLPGTLDMLDQARKAASQPLYDRVSNTTLAVDGGLDSILQRASGAFGRAKELAGINGEKFALGEETPVLNTLLNTRGQKAVPLSQLDTLKRTLYDIEQGHINPETGKLNEMGNAYKDLRRDLVAHIDRLTTDPQTGTSFYKAARDAYAGPSELRTAATLGNQAMSKDAWKIGEMTKDMSASELEAFRVGAFEALRKKVGTEGGQTSLLKMWKEPATSEKLRELFSDEGAYRKFAADVAKEGRLKALESTGRGSQTAARAAAMGDMDLSAVSEAGNLAKSAATGNLSGVASGAANLWNRIKTPEAVRNEMGNILLSRGNDGVQNINQLRHVLEQVKSEKARRSSLASMFVGAQ